MQAKEEPLKVQAKEEAPKEEQAEEEDSGDAAAAPSSNNPYLALAVGDNDDNEGGGADGEASATERMPKRQSAAELAGAALRILCLGGLGEVLEGDSAATAATAAATGRNGSATPLAAAAGSSVLTPGWQHRLQPRGLVNTGNSCFINSILQVRGDDAPGGDGGVNTGNSCFINSILQVRRGGDDAEGEGAGLEDV